MRREWPGVAVEHLRLVGRVEYEFKVAGSAHYVAFHKLKRIDGETTFDSLGRSTRLDLNDTISFLPATAEASGWSVLDGDHSLTVVHLSSTRAETAPSALDRLGPAQYFSSAAAISTIQKLGSLAAGEMPGDAIYAETLAKLLEMELVGFLTGGPHKPERSPGLSAQQLNRVTELIESRIAEDLSLSELASAGGVSRFHFIRAFKRSTGETPHQYVLRRRVEMAKNLLANAEMPIQTVAAQTGFPNPEHFSRTFLQRTGISAREYRKRFR